MTDQRLDARRAALKQVSAQIIDLANNEPNSALKCIHQLSVAGGATEATYQAIEQRIRVDQDSAGAYHLALLAQNTPDLPIDVHALIEVIIHQGDNRQRLALLKNLPLPPVAAIKSAILATGDDAAIKEMESYLANNPEGLGSQHIIANSPSDQIIPLS
ncbi:hypothetical protein [Psychrobacter ciconiae]|uniref:hypothetical protein n=1 Tax=Psychrobacter ciconiae TaxID=1553449 RepID=UPI00191AB0AD|nr:hypothetical protein [Psychrobacter ciconiae]